MNFISNRSISTQLFFIIFVGGALFSTIMLFLNIVTVKKQFEFAEMDKISQLFLAINPLLALSISFKQDIASPLNELVLYSPSIYELEVYNTDLEKIYDFNRGVAESGIELTDGEFLINDTTTGEVLGHIKVRYGNINWSSFISDYNWRAAPFYVSGLFIFFLIYLFISRKIKPLTLLSKEMSRVDLTKMSILKSAPIPKSSSLEATLLWDNYNLMIQTINENMYKIRDQDAVIHEQSKFVAMGEIVSMIAHQWRQPLATISSYSSNIELEYFLGTLDAEALQSHINHINNSTSYLTTTIDDFRNFYKTDKQTTAVEPATEIKKAIEILSDLISGNKISIKFDDVAGGLERFDGFPNEFLQSVINIIKNAIDVLLSNNVAAPEINIEILSDDSNIYVSISDNAGGIPTSVLPKIFDPYFSTKLNLNGTGLGLYMTKNLIESIEGGSIVAKNITGGAMFTITLRRIIC